MLKTYLFRVILIPAGVFVSVMFGGGAATGLEITTFMSSNGPVGGLVAISIVALLYSVMVFLCYEVARLRRAYDYQSFAVIILGSKAWLIYEVSITLAMFGVVAYSTTGGATALADFMGVSRFGVTAVILLAVAFLVFQGRRMVEVSMLLTTLLLLGASLLVAIGTITGNSGEVLGQLQDTTFDFPALGKRVWVYTVVISAYIPIILYAAKDLKSRAEVAFASVASGIAIMLPFAAMHLSFLARFPEVLDQEVPNAWIAEQAMPGWFAGFFVVVLNVVILQTAVGVVQGVIERLDSWSQASRERSLSKSQHAIVAAVILLAALALSGFGVQRLLGWMYSISYWLFLLILFVPLVLVGGRIILRNREPVDSPVAHES